MASNTPTTVINDKRFSPGTPFSSTNKTDSDKITKILSKMINTSTSLTNNVCLLDGVIVN
jgi:hypothetical protein